MKLVHASDLHLITPRYAIGDSRLVEAKAILAKLLATAVEAKATLLVISGDTFDSRWVSPTVLHLLADWLADCAVAGIRVVIVPGNHDGMTTIGDPSTHALRWLAALHLPWVDVILEPGLFQTRDGDDERIDIWALPYPHKRAMDAQLPDVPVDERAIEVGHRIEEAIRTLAIRPDPAIPFVFVGHVSILGAALGSEAAMKLGWDTGISSDVLAPFDYAALGHIHRQQAIAPNAWYAGSAAYLDFKDADTPKGFLVVEVEPGKPPVVQPVPSGARPMHDLTFEQAPDGSLVGRLAVWRDEPIVRATIHATVERPRPEAIAGLVRALRDRGALLVKTVVDLDLPIVEAAVQEVDPEADDTDLLAGFLTEHGQPLEPTLSVGRTLISAITNAEA